MGVYVIVALFLLLGCVTKQTKTVYKIGLLMLFVLSALRNPNLGGTDALVYQEYFRLIPSIFEYGQLQAYRFGIGYGILNSVVKTFFNDYIAFQIVYSLVSLIFLNKIIELLEFQENEKCLFLFCYFCFHFIWNTWIVNRQNIANLIYWMLIILIYKSMGVNRKKTIFISLLAIFVPPLFHSSAWVNVVFLPILFLLNKIDWKAKMIGTVSASLVLFAFGKSLYNFLISITAAFVDDYYSVYILDQSQSSFMNYFLRLSFFVLFCWRYSAEKYKYKNAVLDIMVLMVLIGSVTSVATTRMYEYYAVGLYSCMALFPHSFEKKSKMISILFLGAAMIVIMIQFLVSFDQGHFLNYNFFWNV